MEKIAIVPVGGEISTAELGFLVGPLEETFGASVGFASRIPLPGHAYNRQRDQYLSSMILDVLNSRVRVPENGRVLAVTNQDLYVPDLNFVFGQADTYTGVAIISLARLRPEFFGEAPDDALFHARAITEAVHEIGHTLGFVEHCPDPKCVMHFSNALADTDIKGHRFCIKCRRILGMESRR
ncbi:MAG: archaemetzincin family Zn-dependent metalloprotease [Candidatus Hydrogenedentota bacterium]|nr:MAG: archaemetzincin family Zn-dependent metalloprotease [Candidatus Hydrogenedentota bacterium]